MDSEPRRPERHAQISYEILSDPNLSMTAKCVYGAMERYWFGSGVCFPARSRLARDIGRGLTVLDGSLKELEEKGYITKESRAGRTCDYRPTNQQTGNLEDPQPSRDTGEVGTRNTGRVGARDTGNGVHGKPGGGYPEDRTHKHRTKHCTEAYMETEAMNVDDSVGSKGVTNSNQAKKGDAHLRTAIEKLTQWGYGPRPPEVLLEEYGNLPVLYAIEQIESSNGVQNPAGLITKKLQAGLKPPSGWRPASMIAQDDVGITREKLRTYSHCERCGSELVKSEIQYEDPFKTGDTSVTNVLKCPQCEPGDPIP